ncbi:phosphatidate cytidylyltransferase [Microbacterium sp. EYE_5]|uniref:phosphatidate cytidylyltransferase n=1 Tax=unclassified Microbacterium TaxID=2609290 RepID=UPI002005F426|nr:MULTISPECIES: phosphatidate cytidylyltransferase [unclassified Microbacterium]MCK6080849.1 phosphatidate cytidylyltransferase [Microbacterium sp. EYE_382]MCK6086120.1 phosphatidate cytidylyltransferase [Microbacterium sp. EYE_384]MCK6124382.1 phosphatidate cytidylyltransferase [Microbacterium sp. EYE_80]MCK6127291.1 phosphatidate cytidylyltransferase [Microbacterium sp. EYE_79]MCK6141804.1 phosphatidate cytidylyltransferase [Microbacterium sp. EYE_39]
MSDDASGDDGGRDAPVTRSAARRAGDLPVDPSSFHAHVRAARSEFESQIERARVEFEEANDRINARSGRNLIVATLIGLAIGAVVLGSLLFWKWAFIAFAVPLCLLGVFEFSRALQASGRRIDLPAQFTAATVILASAFVGFLTHWLVTFAAVVLVIVWRLVAQMASRDGRQYGDVLSDTLSSSLVPLYVAFHGSLALVILRQDHGELWVLAVLVVAVSVDTGAYASGVAFGAHPMAPRISPNKTWEGFAGAAVASAVAGGLIGVFMLQLPVWAGLVFGAAILVSATVGDLGESLIKRDLGIKDMSSFLPGHGGVLDRLDSILPSMVPGVALFFLLSPLSALT